MQIRNFMSYKTKSTYSLRRPLDVKHYSWKSQNSMKTFGYKQVFEPIAWKRPATIRLRKRAEPQPYIRLSYIHGISTCNHFSNTSAMDVPQYRKEFLWCRRAKCWETGQYQNRWYMWTNNRPPRYHNGDDARYNVTVESHFGGHWRSGLTAISQLFLYSANQFNPFVDNTSAIPCSDTINRYGAKRMSGCSTLNRDVPD